MIAILAIVVTGTLRRARERAVRADCISRLKVIGFEVMEYGDLRNQSNEIPANMPNDIVSIVKALSNVTSSAVFLYCPGDSRAGARAEPDFRLVTRKNISYSFVPNLLWQSVLPDSIISLDRIDATAAGSTWPTNGNHKGAYGNILFNDGHVEFRKVLPSALKDKDGKEVVLSP